LSYAGQLPDSAQMIWWISLSETLPGVLHAVIGTHADRTGQKVRSLLGMYVGRFACYAVMGVLIGIQPSVMLLALIVLVHFCSEWMGKYASSLSMPLYIQTVDDEELEQANGLMSAVQRVTGIVAQFAATFLILWLSFRSLAWINGMTFIAGGFILWTARRGLTALQPPLHQHKEHRRSESSSFWGDLQESALLLYRNRKLFGLVIQVTLINAALFPLSALFSMHAAASNGFTISSFPFTIALFSMLGSAGVILGNIASGSWFRSMPLTAVIGWNYAAVIGYCAGLWTGRLDLTLMMYLLACACVGILSPKYGAMFAREVERGQLASVSGISSTLSNLGGPFSQVVVGGAAAAISLTAGTLALAILTAGGLALLLLNVIIEQRKPATKESGTESSTL
jgi:MFS family permease